MPSRIIRDSARNSKTLAQLSAAAERMWWRLITVADDHGLFEADPVLLAASCFPRFRRLSVRRVEDWLQEMARAGCVALYVIDGKRYGVFVNWAKHQRPPRSAPKHPLPPANICEHLSADENNCGLYTRIENRDTRIESNTKGGRQQVAAVSLPPLANLWNQKVQSPTVLRVSGQRLVRLKARMATYPDLGWWGEVLDRLVATPFLRGKNERGWVADFDWLIRNDENPARILEGKYAGVQRQIAPLPYQDEPALSMEERASNLRRIGEMVREIAARKAAPGGGGK